MYETFAALKKPPNPRQQLWRYIPYKRLKDLLVSEELFFTHLPAFSDGLEGSLTAKSREKLFHWLCLHGSTPLVASREVTEYEKLQEGFFANCWHMNNYESNLMWKAYADRGFAIRTTFERVQASFDDFSGVITGGVVDYVDFESDVTELGNAFNHVTTKDLPYRDEREFRLFFWRPDPRNQKLEPNENGIRVRVDVRMLIERIYINPIENSVPPELHVLLEEKGIECHSSLIKTR